MPRNVQYLIVSSQLIDLCKAGSITAESALWYMELLAECFRRTGSAEYPPMQVRNCDLARLWNVAPRTVTDRLRVLKETGLILHEQAGRYTWWIAPLVRHVPQPPDADANTRPAGPSRQPRGSSAPPPVETHLGHFGKITEAGTTEAGDIASPPPSAEQLALKRRRTLDGLHVNFRSIVEEYRDEPSNQTATLDAEPGSQTAILGGEPGGQTATLDAEPGSQTATLDLKPSGLSASLKGPNCPPADSAHSEPSSHPPKADFILKKLTSTENGKLQLVSVDPRTWQESPKPSGQTAILHINNTEWNGKEYMNMNIGVTAQKISASPSPAPDAPQPAPPIPPIAPPPPAASHASPASPPPPSASHVSPASPPPPSSPPEGRAPLFRRGCIAPGEGEGGEAASAPAPLSENLARARANKFIRALIYEPHIAAYPPLHPDPEVQAYLRDFAERFSAKRVLALRECGVSIADKLETEIHEGVRQAKLQFSSISPSVITDEYRRIRAVLREGNKPGSASALLVTNLRRMIATGEVPGRGPLTVGKLADRPPDRPPGPCSPPPHTGSTGL